MFVGTVLNLAATLPCAYAMSRNDLKGPEVSDDFLYDYHVLQRRHDSGYLNIKSLGLPEYPQRYPD